MTNLQRQDHAQATPCVFEAVSFLRPGFVPELPIASEPNADNWPELPENPLADWSDEMAALLREAERRGRLDREQKGKLWNA